MNNSKYVEISDPLRDIMVKFLSLEDKLNLCSANLDIFSNLEFEKMHLNDMNVLLLSIRRNISIQEKELKRLNSWVSNKDVELRNYEKTYADINKRMDAQKKQVEKFRKKNMEYVDTNRVLIQTISDLHMQIDIQASGYHRK